MTVQSVTFLVFAALVWLLALPTRRAGTRQALLLVASYLFYATWGLGFLAILLASSLMNYALGIAVRKDPSARRLAFGIGANLVLLGVFRYFPPLANTVFGDGAVSIAVPVGISFWTFEAMSYLFDLYREEDIDPSPVEFFLYMAFWPTVLLGPVCRLPEMLPQFRSVERPAWDDIRVGVSRIVIGLFMKVVLAQLLGQGFNPGEGVNYGFDVVGGGVGGLDAWALAIGFGFQLFFDFAGYSNIVIGVARLFGIRLRENFNRPYLSTTPSEFWTRWHMSLSSWIRDYVFIPLATMRRERWWRNVALVGSMVLFGLWHGPTATFLLWGLYQGLLLVGHRGFERVQKRRHWSTTAPAVRIIGWAVTFGLISLGWIFFRSDSVSEALSMWRAVLSPRTYLHLSLRPSFYIVTALLVCGYFAYVGARMLLQHWDGYRVVHEARWLLAPVAYAVAILAVIVWSRSESLFIYFQF